MLHPLKQKGGKKKKLTILERDAPGSADSSGQTDNNCVYVLSHLVADTINEQHQ